MYLLPITDIILPYFVPTDNNVQNLTEIDRKYIQKIDPMNKINESNFEIKSLSYSSVLYIAKKFFESFDKKNDSDFTQEELKNFYKYIQENPEILILYNKFSQTLDEIIEKEDLDDKPKVDLKKAIINTNNILLKDLNKYSYDNLDQKVDLNIYFHEEKKQINGRNVTIKIIKLAEINERNMTNEIINMEEIKSLKNLVIEKEKEELAKIDKFTEKNLYNIGPEINNYLKSCKLDKDLNIGTEELLLYKEFTKSCDELKKILNNDEDKTEKTQKYFFDKKLEIDNLVKTIKDMMNLENFQKYTKIEELVIKKNILNSKIKSIINTFVEKDKNIIEKFNSIIDDNNNNFETKLEDNEKFVVKLKFDELIKKYNEHLKIFLKMIDKIEKLMNDKPDIIVPQEVITGFVDNIEKFSKAVKDGLDKFNMEITELLDKNIKETDKKLYDYLTEISGDVKKITDNLTNGIKDEFETVKKDVRKISLATINLKDEIYKNKKKISSIGDSDIKIKKNNNLSVNITELEKWKKLFEEKK